MFVYVFLRNSAILGMCKLVKIVDHLSILKSIQFNSKFLVPPLNTSHRRTLIYEQENTVTFDILKFSSVKEKRFCSRKP